MSYTINHDQLTQILTQNNIIGGTGTTGPTGTTGTVNQSPYKSLGDTSNNRYLYFHNDRGSSNLVHPIRTRNVRPTTGITYPRNKIRTSL